MNFTRLICGNGIIIVDYPIRFCSSVLRKSICDDDGVTRKNASKKKINHAVVASYLDDSPRAGEFLDPQGVCIPICTCTCDRSCTGPAAAAWISRSRLTGIGPATNDRQISRLTIPKPFRDANQLCSCAFYAAQLSVWCFIWKSHETKKSRISLRYLILIYD